ncbi:acetyl-CoA carboxylase biotin carboxyl carrier protein subunit [Candidatus Acetothermia bacterium]|nr:acetyl-CoA carboxylase biotin carboxyl carrier protein subunit [Candidatus Acetothermia bacterium]
MKYLIEVAGRQLEVQVSRQSQTEAVVEMREKRQGVELKRVGQNYVLLLEGRSIDLGISGQNGQYKIQLAGQEYEVHVERALLQKYKQFLKQAQSAAQSEEKIVAPMPGLILKIEAQPGQHVQAGDKLVIIDAMKMENEIRAPHDGIVEKVAVQEKQQVEKGALLCSIRRVSEEP